MDRTAVILEIFHRHAQSREAKAQVDIARLEYLAPRLREVGGADRVRGGIGMKRVGETKVELDRRKVRDRIAELRSQIDEIASTRYIRRDRRRGVPKAALVGYTNAGTSSWMRALTGSDVLVADKLFATLDTTVRQLAGDARPTVLVSDTVGFIRKLPHDLVASFRSTLDEAVEADLLLHVVDAADPDFRAQMAVTREVLGEIGAGSFLRACCRTRPIASTRRPARPCASSSPMRWSCPAGTGPTSTASARRSSARSRATSWRRISSFRTTRGVVGKVHEQDVLSESWAEDGLHVRMRGPQAAVDRLRALIARP